MKLEYLDDTTGGGKYPRADPEKLIRLYDFSYVELTMLKQAIRENLVDNDSELIISNLAYVQSLNCTLTFLVSENDLGVKFSSGDNNDFLGRFARSTYINMLEIIDGLIKDGEIVNGFNWLYDPDTDEKIDLLLSSGIGSW